MANENDDIKQEGTENPEQPKHHTWKDIIHEEFEKIDSEFPLSGGETEEDFKGADKTGESEENTAKTDPGAQAPAEAPNEHHSMFDNLIHKIQKLDTEFPLSGGETEEDFEGADDEEEDEEKPKEDK